MVVENSLIHEIDVLRRIFCEDYVAAEVVFPKKTRHAHERLQDPQIMRLWTKYEVLIDIEVFICVITILSAKFVAKTALSACPNRRTR